MLMSRILDDPSGRFGLHIGWSLGGEVAELILLPHALLPTDWRGNHAPRCSAGGTRVRSRRNGTSSSRQEPLGYDWNLVIQDFPAQSQLAGTVLKVTTRHRLWTCQPLWSQFRDWSGLNPQCLELSPSIAGQVKNKTSFPTFVAHYFSKCELGQFQQL